MGGKNESKEITMEQSNAEIIDCKGPLPYK